MNWNWGWILLACFSLGCASETSEDSGNGADTVADASVEIVEDSGGEGEPATDAAVETVEDAGSEVDSHGCGEWEVTDPIGDSWWVIENRLG